MREHKYILDLQGDPVPCHDVLEWAEWFERSSVDGSRVVQQDTIGEQLVSTAFIGIDSGCADEPPYLWETMIFGGPHDRWAKRAASRGAALEHHAEALKLIRGDTCGNS